MSHARSKILEAARIWFLGLARGREQVGSTYFLSRWLFLRLLGLIYLIAFASLWMQIKGLIGEHGILPIADYLSSISPTLGITKFWHIPTLCWFSASDTCLIFQCAAGCLFSLCIVVGIAPGLMLFFNWILYLSLSVACREFLGFQWDVLLLETGLLAIFFAPRQWLPRFSQEQPPSRIVLWLLRWLLFRLMFMSGAVKLISGDPTWKNYTALIFHYETQPLPTWIGWYAHQLPPDMQKTSVAMMFLIELIVPFLIFCGRRARMIAGIAFITLMTLIALTGNYCFFNFLTITLCVLLFDDAALRRMIPGRWRDRCPANTSLQLSPKIFRVGTATLAVVILWLSVSETCFRLFRIENPWPIFSSPVEWASTLRSVNSYGLFSVMTTTRPEIVMEGSNDGTHWQAYEFKWKPGEVKRAPGFVAPHQPRLDWQMWFAALGSVDENPWFIRFELRLLQGSPEVLGLMKTNPFPDKPPKYVRSVLYVYRFANPATRSKTGAWWTRELQGLYSPPVTLEQVKPKQELLDL